MVGVIVGLAAFIGLWRYSADRCVRKTRGTISCTAGAGNDLIRGNGELGPELGSGDADQEREPPVLVGRPLGNPASGDRHVRLGRMTRPGVVTGRVVHTADVTVRDRRAVVGLVALGALVGLFTLVDSESPLLAAVAMGLGCRFWRLASSSQVEAPGWPTQGRSVYSAWLSRSCPSPLGRYPRRGGIGEAPAGLVALWTDRRWRLDLPWLRGRRMGRRTKGR